MPDEEKSNESEATKEVESKEEKNEEKKEVTRNEAKKSGGKNPLHNALWPFLTALLFFAVFYGVSIYINPTAKDIVNPTVLNVFEKYSQYLGAIFGLLSMIGLYILYLIKKLSVKTKFSFLFPIFLASAYIPWILFARQLIYFEKRYTDIGRGVIDYIGQPLWYSVCIMFGLAGLWFVLEIIFTIKNRNK